MKRRLLALLTLFFSMAFAKPFSVSFLTLEKPEFSVAQTFDYNLLYSAKYENSGYATVARMDARELLLAGGFYANSKCADIAVSVWYAPCFWNLLSVGVSAKYHYYKFCDEGSEIFCEHNILPGAFVRVSLNDLWNLYVNSGALIKLSIIDSYPSNIRTTDNTLFLNTGCIFTPSDRWRFFFEAGNCALFEDALFGAMLFTLGFNHALFEHFTLGSELFLKWTDGSVVQDSFSQLGLRASFGVLF